MTRHPRADDRPGESLGDGADAAFSEAVHLFDLRRWNEALTALAPVLAADGSDPDANALACRCHLMLEQPRLAEPFARAATSNGDDPLAPFLLTIVEIRLGRRDAALSVAEEAVRRTPEQALAHMAMAYVGIDDRHATERTRRSALAALDLAPADPDVLVLAAQAHMYNGRRRVRPDDRRTARRFLGEALALAPDHVEALHELATLEAMRGRTLQSMRGLGSVLRSEPLHERSHDRLRHLMSVLMKRSRTIAFALAVALALCGGGGDPTPATLVVGGLSLLALCWVLLGLRATLRSALVPTVRSWAKRDREAAWWFCLVLVGLTANAVAAFVPGGVGQASFAVVWFALVGGLLMSWSRSP